ncbi:MAG: hypothetical protein M1831_006614 [Alyxoria varia]|nr:MAG: hypothetical protein M1831_006614 [Alyxoria varia]
MKHRSRTAAVLQASPISLVSHANVVPVSPFLLRKAQSQCSKTTPFSTLNIIPQERKSESKHQPQLAAFSTSQRLRKSLDPEKPTATRSPRDIEHNVTHEELSDFDKRVAEDKETQIRTPWHREGSEKPPVARPRSAGAMTKGKLLTTPSRLLKLVLPLTTRDQNTDRKTVEPLALLVHPQQPLSYLERLIQSELPASTNLIDEKTGREKIPVVNFAAADASKEEELPQTGKVSGVEDDSQEDSAKPEPSSSQSETQDTTPSGVEYYSGLGHEQKPDSSNERPFVRWSKSTEIGNFIRDAARGREFAISIEGAPRDIRVSVPSFNDRTYYLRMRLRKKASEIASMASMKRDCDLAAHASAQRVAYAGFAGMLGWGGVVWWLTFMTSLGWDVMEPVTYLVGLAGILGGYGWFLFNRREASYQSAMNLTVSKRQNALYEARGFDLRKWEYLVEEGNQLRREIRAIAAEYDVDWNEKEDATDKQVIKALREHREGKKGKGQGTGEDEERDEGHESEDDEKDGPKRKL